MDSVQVLWVSGLGFLMVKMSICNRVRMATAENLFLRYGAKFQCAENLGGIQNPEFLQTILHDRLQGRRTSPAEGYESSDCRWGRGPLDFSHGYQGQPVKNCGSPISAPECTYDTTMPDRSMTFQALRFSKGQAENGRIYRWEKTSSMGKVEKFEATFKKVDLRSARIAGHVDYDRRYG